MVYICIMNDENYNTGGGDTLDFNNKFSYPLQYLWESDLIRRQYNCMLHRVKLAMTGRPSKNLYQEELTSNIEKISDEGMRKRYKKACLKVPEGRSFAIRNAVQTRANQMSGGVDTYDYQINDPYGMVDDDTEELLAATCRQDYINNRLERFSETFSRDLSEAGITATLVKYCPKTDRNRVLRINPKNIWVDTKYSSTGEERYRGYSFMASWRQVKDMIKQDGDEINLTIKAPDHSIFDSGELDLNAKVGRRKIRSLNGLDIYVEDINKLAMSTQLQGPYGLTANEYMHDLSWMYNSAYYRSLASDPKARTNNGYGSDDVEITVLYDLLNKIEFKILNRRYVISANSKAFRRKLVYRTYDPRDGRPNDQIRDYELECPLKFEWENTENQDSFPYPTSTVMALLDSFDQLCALRAKRQHVVDILSILRIETNASDAQSLRGLLNIMGIVLDDIQGDINTINFAYDFSPLDSQIQYYEDLIKRTLNAYDEFDALQAMGDRATAAESGMALSAVAQGLTTHQNAIMRMYSDIARQCIANRVAYSTRQEFPVYNRGNYSVVTAQQMALLATVDVKPKLAKQIKERQNASTAITLLGALGNILNPDGVAAFVEDAMMGTVPRRMARSFIQEQGPSPEEVALAQTQANNQAEMLRQNQQAYLNNPTEYEVDNVMENSSPEEVDAIIGNLMADQEINPSVEQPEQTEQTEQESELIFTPEGAGNFYNQPTVAEPTAF